MTSFSSASAEYNNEITYFKNKQTSCLLKSIWLPEISLKSKTVEYQMTYIGQKEPECFRRVGYKKVILIEETF